MGKTYCEDCIHYDPDPQIINDRCCKWTSHKDTPLRREKAFLDPLKDNAKNRCPHFVNKEKAFP